MQGYLPRIAEKEVANKLNSNPIAAILGPRQAGKTTLALEIIKSYNKAVHLDLESPSDLNKLEDPEAYFSMHRDSLVVIDEIQKKPELFPILRVIADRHGKNGQFLILGLASPPL